MAMGQAVMTFHDIVCFTTSSMRVFNVKVRTMVKPNAPVSKIGFDDMSIELLVNRE